MLTDGMMIILIFVLILFIPLIVVFIVLAIYKCRRDHKKKTYKGITQGTVVKIAKKGLDHPWVIHVSYKVNGREYTIKETTKLKSAAIKIGKIPIGQKKTFVLGKIGEGDLVEIHYDETCPENAVIYKNEGVVTG